MLTEEIRRFLQRPLLARMATIDEEGYPHVVPVWFDLDGDDFMMIIVRSTRKISHIQKNAKGAIAIGGDTGDGGGYLFKGSYTIEEDIDDEWMKKLIYRYEPEVMQAEKFILEWTPLDIVVVRMKVSKVLKI